jgi:hypothetical protein
MSGTKENEKRLTVDIRLFLLVIVSAMAISFGVGVTLGPSAFEVAKAAQAASLPKVTSVDFSQQLQPSSDETIHEPAGQVSEKSIFGLICHLLALSSPGYRNITYLFYGSICW